MLSKWFLKHLTACLLTLLAVDAIPPARGATTEQPAVERRFNVLFIAVDDLRTQLGTYGHEEMVTPAMDRLAREGRAFARHYVQVPTCGASRAVLLTGQYPSAPREYENGALATRPPAQAERFTSLPELFRQNGYTTISIGKITHEPHGLRRDGSPELPDAWDQIETPAGRWGTAWNAFFG